MRAPIVVAFTCLLAFAQTTRIPKGIHEAEQATNATEQSIPPPVTLSHSNPRQLQKDADELAHLADSIPAAVGDVNRGTLPKDLNQRLKRIEKLSKQLRDELNSR